MRQRWHFKLGDPVPSWFQTLGNCYATFTRHVIITETDGRRRVYPRNRNQRGLGGPMVHVVPIDPDQPMAMSAVLPTSWDGRTREQVRAHKAGRRWMPN